MQKYITSTMQKYSILCAIFLSVCFIANCQLNFETKKYPVSKIVFWNDKGVLLYGEDPTGNTLLKECTMLIGNPKPDWNKTIMPIVDDPDIIYSESSDYLYFLDKISAKVGKISFNQFHKAGTLRKNNMALNSKFFTLGQNINMDDLTIAAAGTTKNFLVVLFEYYDSNTSEYKYAIALIKHVTFTMELFWVPELVITKNELNSGFKGSLRLLGDINGKLVLSQPEATEKFVGKNHFSFNEDGEFSKRKQLEWPEKGKYPLMSYDIDLSEGNIIGGHLTIDLSKNPDLSHQGGEKIIDNSKYNYGFYGTERPEGKNPDRVGVYTVKYSGSGGVEWKRFIPFEGKMLEDKNLIQRNTVLGQSLVNENGKLSFSFGYDDQIWNVIIDEKTGEVSKKMELIKGASLNNLSDKKYHILLQRLGYQVDFSKKVAKVKGKWYQSSETINSKEGSLELVAK